MKTPKFSTAQIEFLQSVFSKEQLHFLETPEKKRCSSFNREGNPCKKLSLDGMDTCFSHKEPKRPQERETCTGLNKKGNPCKKKAILGKKKCSAHNDNESIISQEFDLE